MLQMVLKLGLQGADSRSVLRTTDRSGRSLLMQVGTLAHSVPTLSSAHPCRAASRHTHRWPS